MNKNFDKETFPEINYNTFIKKIVTSIDLTKSISVKKLYKEKNKKYFFQEKEFKGNFKEFVNDNPSELMGIYIFSEHNPVTKEIKPVYIGISRDLRRRMADHLIRKNKSSATWASLMEKNKYKKNIMPLIKNYPKKDNLKVFFIKFDDNFKLHLAEILLVLHYKPEWNSFKTH